MKIYKLSALLLILLAGCAPEVTDWTPAESPKENKVDRAIFSYTVHYPAHASEMGKNEKCNFLKFLKTHIPSPLAVTVILEECGGHSEKRIKDIQRELLLFGIPYDVITVEYNDCEYHHHKRRIHHRKDPCHPSKRKKSVTVIEPSSYVEVIVERYVVIPPSCANFYQTIGDAQQAQAHTNFGCADTANFGMMIANPRDLIKGRPLGDSDGTVIAKGVDRYRKDKVKALMETSTNVAPGTLSTIVTATPSEPSGGAAVGTSAATGGAY